MVAHRRNILGLVAGLALLVLAGCEFPGSGVQVSFTSPVRDTRITGVPHPYSLPVEISVTGGTPDAFELTNNGTKVSGVTAAGSTYTASVPLDDGANTLVARATAAGFTYTAKREVYYPFLAFKDGQDADVAMGQTSFTSSSPATSQNGLSAPQGAPALLADKLYIPDRDNNRVVGYATVPGVNGALFDYLLGHADFTAQAAETISASSMTAPTGVAAGDGKLLAVDTDNSRVLIWSGAPTTTNAPAQVAVGEPGLYTTPPTPTPCDATHLFHPEAAVAAGGKLIVADTGHNRVLIWDSVPTVSGAPADLVLGRSDCTSGNASATAFNQPSGVWSDGNRLLVADTGNNRVLLWDTFPTALDPGADVVIGQATMTGGSIQAANDTGSSATVHTGLSRPKSVDSNGNQIFIADSDYNRVVVFDRFPGSNGAHADRVLGQTSLDGTTTDAGGIGPNTLDHAQGVRAFDGFVIVADTGNSRELLYRPPTP